MKYKRFAVDSILNIVVTFIPLIVLQFVIYPLLAKDMTQVEYGNMISSYSLMYLIGGTLGTELNKERLVKEEIYSKNNVKGDFNIVLFINIFLGIIACLTYSYFSMKNLDTVDMILLVVSSVLIALNSYMQVEYRIELNYKKIAATQLLPVIGYVVGYFVFMWSERWIFIFIIGFSFALIYNLKNTKLLREPFRKTKFFYDTIKDDVHLVAAGLLTRALTYGDKLFLLPIGGGAMVSIYYIASLVGKTILMSIEPINTVMLSYLVKMKRISTKKFGIILALVSAVCAVGYGICMIFSPYVLEFLYPQWAEETNKILWIVTLAMCISAMTGVVNSFVLKECPLKWQVITNVISVVVFFVAVPILLKTSGLFGYCLGVFISYSVKLIFIIILYIKITKQVTTEGA